MKFVSAIFKILAALAFVAGAIYLVATYGDKIVAWAKKMIPSDLFRCCAPQDEEPIEVVAEEPVEEAPVEEAPTAEDADFVG